jgi:hypothetical protein
MAIKLRNKGQTFSLISILMSALFILLFSSILAVSGSNQADISEAQNVLLTNYIQNLPNYIGSLTAKSMYPILNYSIYHLEDPSGQGYYIDYKKVLMDCLNSGSYIDTSIPPYNVRKLCSDSGQNHSIRVHIDDLLTLSTSAYDAQYSYEILSIDVYQSDAYELEVDLVINFQASRKEVYQSSLINVTKQISLLGLPNPATVGEDYEQLIRYAPNRELTRSTNFFGNISLIANYTTNEYYFRDSQGTSFVDKAEGISVFDLDYNNPYGIVSFIPAEQGANNFYISNTTAHLDFLYESGAQFDCSVLRRIDDPLIDDDILFPQSFLFNDLGLNGSNSVLEVCGCCDSSGCDDSCG